MPTITLTTDFGTRDPFIGAMRGVILSIAPDASIVDITHGIAPQDVTEGALALEAAAPYFRDGAIHVAVVDPGVGTERAAIAVRTGSAIFIGPDNGLFTLALDQVPDYQVRRLTNTALHLDEVSATFHGRDIFAPVAAHLAMGVPFEHLGEEADGLVRFHLPDPLVQEASFTGQVIHLDHFGNAITNFRRESLDEWLGERGYAALTVHAGGRTIRGVHTTFANVEPTEPVVYVGSGGRVEIAVRNGSAGETLGLAPGDEIRFEL